MTKYTKTKFFKVTVESVLLYESSSWTLTIEIGNMLNGTCTHMNVHWSQRMTDQELYNGITKSVYRLFIAT